jgi:hypothetical protein
MLHDLDAQRLILDSFEAVLVVGSPDRALRPGLP